MLTDAEVTQLKIEILEGNKTARKLAVKYGVSESSIYRYRGILGVAHMTDEEKEVGVMLLKNWYWRY